MKLLVAFCLIAVVAAAPPVITKVDYPKGDVSILKFENDNFGDGNYRYAWEQSDGSKAEQLGEIQNVGREDEYLAVKGSFTWIGPDGVTYKVTYTADTDGYKPEIEQGPGGAVPNHIATLLG